VDFAVLDADAGGAGGGAGSGALELTECGLRIAPGSLRNPVVCVANYVFDTLKQDA
jgi:hypothetical protein